jgi:hypothetical protein
LISHKETLAVINIRNIQAKNIFKFQDQIHSLLKWKQEKIFIGLEFAKVVLFDLKSNSIISQTKNQQRSFPLSSMFVFAHNYQ